MSKSTRPRSSEARTADQSPASPLSEAERLRFGLDAAETKALAAKNAVKGAAALITEADEAMDDRRRKELVNTAVPLLFQCIEFADEVVGRIRQLGELARTVAPSDFVADDRDSDGPQIAPMADGDEALEPVRFDDVVNEASEILETLRGVVRLTRDAFSPPGRDATAGQVLAAFDPVRAILETVPARLERVIDALDDCTGQRVGQRVTDGPRIARVTIAPPDIAPGTTGDTAEALRVLAQLTGGELDEFDLDCPDTSDTVGNHFLLMLTAAWMWLSNKQDCPAALAHGIVAATKARRMYQPTQEAEAVSA